MNELDRKVLEIVNNWHSNRSEVQETDFQKFTVPKKKFSEKYMEKTGKALNINTRIEAHKFNQICNSLSQNYSFSENLLDEYLDWCFENYEFFIKKYNIFSLNTVALYASDWRRGYLVFDDLKTTYDDISSIVVSQNFFHYCEKYGIVLITEKLLNEKRTKKKEILEAVKVKVKELPRTNEGMNRLKNILRITVENEPYKKEYALYDYRKIFKDSFKYFSKEPWCNPKV
jgi:hypothetical protein